jgi:hypothetical protein
VSPVRYELDFNILEDDILHSHRRENLESYMSKVIEHSLTIPRELTSSQHEELTCNLTIPLELTSSQHEELTCTPDYTTGTDVQSARGTDLHT